MMFKVLPILLLIALVQGRSAKDNSEDPKNEATTVGSEGPKNEACKLWNGEPGICVVYYTCPLDTNNDTTLIDLRGGEQNLCESYLNICCDPDKVQEYSPKKEKDQ